VSDTMSVYAHIPFCARKCAYCDFLSGVSDAETRKAYARKLIEEIKLAGDFARERKTETVFLGGGTPTILGAEELSAIIKALRESFFLDGSEEFTVEANPGTLSFEKLQAIRESGANRLSVGLQSADNEELRLLGRIHTWEKFQEEFALAGKAGFENINIDLISAIPGQTVASWERTLNLATGLWPEHISAYGLIIEPGTKFFEIYGNEDVLPKGWPPLPDEDTERAIARVTAEILPERGYSRYEFSNYAKPGFESLHNIGYWTGRPYLGLGLGASSYLDGIRFRNPDSLKAYMNADLSFAGRGEGAFPGNYRVITERVGRKEEMEEFMFLGLRLIKGVSEAEFARRFGASLNSVYGGVIATYEKSGFLCRREGRLCLSEAGIAVSNRILSDFLLDSEPL